METVISGRVVGVAVAADSGWRLRHLLRLVYHRIPAALCFHLSSSKKQARIQNFHVLKEISISAISNQTRFRSNSPQLEVSIPVLKNTLNDNRSLSQPDVIGT